MRYGMAVGVLLIAATALDAQTTVFEEALAGQPSAAWSNRTVEKTPANGEPMLGRFGKQRVTLSLKTLPDHAWVRVRFDLHICGSWDGDSPEWGPDGFKLTTGDERTLIDTTFSNGWANAFTQGKGQSWPGVIGVHRSKPRAGAKERNTLGYRHGKQAADSTYAIDVLLPHTGDALALHFDGAPDEAIGKEFWGLSNVRVTTHAQPPAGADADLDKAWAALRADDPTKAVRQAVAANERFVEHVEAAIARGELTRPIALPKPEPHTVTIMRDESDEGHFNLLCGKEQRQAHMTAHVLQVIGTDRARAALKRIEQLNAGEQDRLRTLTVSVIDKQSKQPMPGVKVSFRGGCYNYSPTTTDTEGKATLRIVGPLPAYLGSVCKAKGKIDMRVHWLKITEDDPLPESFTYEMADGAEIGGRVINEDDQPVAGAQVAVHLSITRQEPANGVAYPDVSELKTKTDRDGRWAVSKAPAGFTRASLKLSHKRYINDTRFGESGTHTPQALREKTAVSVMKRGLTLAGRVLDADGKPVAGAEVKQGPDRWGTDYPTATAGRDGRFVFENTRPGPVVLTVQAAGHAPDLKRLTVSAESEPVEFKLEKPSTIRIRLIDEAGEPISGATIVADTWRGFRSIEWRAETDPAGEAEWTGAPSDEVAYDIVAKDRMSVRNQSLAAGGDEPVVITMRPLLKIAGTVVDAETGEAVDKFKVVPGIDWDEARPTHWEYHAGQEHRAGTFETTFSYPRFGHRVRIDADGYAPFVSERFTGEGGGQKIAVKLRAAPNIEGVVVDAKGQPVEGVEVYVATAAQFPHIQNGKCQRHTRMPMSKTDASGRYALPPQIDAFILVAVHEQAGYATAPADELGEDGRIELLPWATVRGVVKVGKKPVPNARVTYSRNDAPESEEPRAYFHNSASTDENGRYVFNHVPAGKGRVSRMMQTGPGMYSTTGGEPCDAKPGESLTVNLGGKGRPITGRLVAPRGVEVHGFAHSMCWVREKHEQEPPPVPVAPDGAEQMTQEEWMQSEAGKAWLKGMREKLANLRSYNFRADSDGKFTIPDVEPGEYEVSVYIYAPPKSNFGGFDTMLAMANQKFTVGPIAGGASDEPMDIGEVGLAGTVPPGVGDYAPPLEVKTFDGKTVKLRDHEGKHVLLVFWATWSEQCLDQTPHLKRVYEKFGEHEKFAMISLNLDDEPEPARKHIAENKLAWPQGSLGPWDETRVPGQFSVQGVPHIVLIDGEGKIVATDLQVAKLEETIAAALGERP